MGEARGAEPDDAAAAAGRRDDARPEEEEPARQPGQGGVETDRRTTLTPRPTEAGTLKAGTAAGPGTVADIREGRPRAEAEPVELGEGAAAHSAAGSGQTFEGMVEGYPGSFWNAIEEDIIEKPELMDWNEWQSWRKSDGGLPKGARHGAVQRTEVLLFKAAMEKYHGLDHAEKKKRMKQEAKLLKKSQEEAVLTARRLFSTRSVGSTGSSRAAANASPLLTRAGLLLPNKENYGDFVN